MVIKYKGNKKIYVHLYVYSYIITLKVWSLLMSLNVAE